MIFNFTNSKGRKEGSRRKREGARMGRRRKEFCFSLKPNQIKNLAQYDPFKYQWISKI